MSGKALLDKPAVAPALNRYGTAEEVAALVAHLASDEARNITGATILIDGGFAA